jgi:predicted phosphodiesterase
VSAPALELPRLAIDPARPLALLADLHANLEAVESVGAWLEERSISQVLVLGDLIGYGAAPQEVLDYVRERGWLAVRGNHEDMLIDASHVARSRSLRASARLALDWTRSRLREGALAGLERLPLAAHAGEELLAFHGSLLDPRYCYAYIYEFSLEPNARRLRSLGMPQGALACFGHTHRPAIFAVSGDACADRLADAPALTLRADHLHLVNPGSVGFPRDRDPRASFMVYDASSRRLSCVRLPYDVGAAAARIRREGYAPELVERLFAAL